MKSSSISFLNLEELEKSVKQKQIEDNPKTLIQIFTAFANKEEIQNIQYFFQKQFPKAKLIGSTTDGIIDGLKVYDATKNLAVFSHFNNTEIESSFIKLSKNNNSFNGGQTLANNLIKKNTKVLIAFADGLNINGEEFLKGISLVSSNITISGGLAGDNGNMKVTYVFDKENILSNGAVAVALNNSNLYVKTEYSFDWTALGKKLKITKSVKNRVYEIDGIPAVDIYAKYFGHELASKLPNVGIEFPLIFNKDSVEIGRAVLSKHPDGSLTFAGNIPEGTLVRFGIGNIDRVLQNINYNVEKLMEELRYKPESIFIYSCMARRRFLGKNVKNELKVLEQLGTVYGFYTYGEFFHSNNNNQLLNETVTLLSLSESKNSMHKHLEKSSFESEKRVLRAEHAVANLANTVSNELEDLNTNLHKRIKKHTDLIYNQVYFDKLTQLPNRLSLIKEMKDNIGKTIILINIDDFTTINDFYGYLIGDKILKFLRDILQKTLIDESPKIYKLPSDEFAIIVDLSCTKQNVDILIKKIFQFMENQHFTINQNTIHFTVTISAAMINKEQTGLANADMTLKLAKKSRKDYMIYKEDMKLSEQYEANLLMAKRIKEAIAEDRIIPFFQPIYDAKTLKIEKYEALVRLKTKEGKIISPFHFLGISQKIKVYPQITEIMINKTFELMSKTGANCSVNLDFDDIYDAKTKKMFFDKIQEYNIAKQLTVEILENQEIADEEQFNEFINNLHKLGVKIAIDDFGSGFANFEHIAKINSQFIKIDGTLIKNIDKDITSRLIVETIVIFAQKLKQKTVAEFVHSKEVYDIVQEIGVDYIQGYYFAEPKAELVD